MSEIRITYVTITYNAAKVLKRTLDSVLEQDYPNIEHLIIDGASTDDTQKLVSDYIAQSNAAENGHQIQVTSEPDKGIYDAMNKGLRCLTGDYVCFLNAGDFLPAPNTASHIVSAVANSSLFTLHSSLPTTHHPTPRNCQQLRTATPTLWMARGISCTTADWHHPNTLRGNRSARACWYAIRLFMPVPIMPLPHLTTCSIAIRPMLTGVSE